MMGLIASGHTSPIDDRDYRRPELIDTRLRSDRSRPTSPGSLGGHTPRPTTTMLADEIKKMMSTVGQNLFIEKERDRRKRDFDEVVRKFVNAAATNEADSGTMTQLRLAKDQAKEKLDKIQNNLRSTEAEFTATGIEKCLETLVRSSASNRTAALEDELARTRKEVQELREDAYKAKAKLGQAIDEVQRIEIVAKGALGEASYATRNLKNLSQSLAAKALNQGESAQMKALADKLTNVDNAAFEALQKKLISLENQLKQVVQAHKFQDTKIAKIAAAPTAGANNASADVIEVSNPNPNVTGLENRVNKLEEKLQHELKYLAARDDAIASRVESSDTGLKEVAARAEAIDTRVDTNDTGIQGLNLVQKRIDGDLRQLNTNFTEFDEDIAKLNERVETLESAPISRPSEKEMTEADASITEATPRKSSIQFTGKAEELRKELKISPAVYTALGEIPAKISGLVGMQKFLAEAQGQALDDMDKQVKTQIGELRQELLPMVQKLHAKQQEVDIKQNTIREEQRKLEKQTREIAAKAESKANTPQFQQNPGISDASAQELMKRISDVDTKYGILHRGLDTRMQNTHTDTMAAQILGSLQSAYPNLANTEEQLRLANEGRAIGEKRLSDLNAKMTKIRDVVNVQGSEVQAGKIARVAMEEMKNEVVAKVEELQRDLHSMRVQLDNTAANAHLNGGPLPQFLPQRGPSTNELRNLQIDIAKLENAMSQITKDHSTIKQNITDIGASMSQIEHNLEEQINNVERRLFGELDSVKKSLGEIEPLLKLEDGDTVKEKIVIVMDYAQILSDDLKAIKERYKKLSQEATDKVRSASAGDKRNASRSREELEEESDDTPMAAVRRRKKKQKRTGAFVDDDDEDE